MQRPRRPRRKHCVSLRPFRPRRLIVRFALADAATRHDIQRRNRRTRRTTPGFLCGFREFCVDRRSLQPVVRNRKTMTQVPPVLRKTSMVVVVDYDPAWPDRFEQLRARIWPAVADVALGIEHVGSTAVPGLAAKPIIDMTVVVPSRPDVTVTIDRLATLGYRHRGNLGIEDREAFDHADGLPAHNLYVCPQETLGVINQLAVRDHL